MFFIHPYIKKPYIKQLTISKYTSFEIIQFSSKIFFNIIENKRDIASN